MNQMAPIKVTATKLAKRKAPIGEAESRDTVLEIRRLEKTKWPPPDVVDYLTAELLRLTKEGRNN